MIDTQFQPILEPARPIYKPTPTTTFIKPEPIYKPEPSYAPSPSPTPGPIYLKPFETQTEDSYGKPLGDPIVQFVAVSTTQAPPTDYVNPFDTSNFNVISSDLHVFFYKVHFQHFFMVTLMQQTSCFRITL